jgi:ribosomal-protein-alanine N-acetyltransferase
MVLVPIKNNEEDNKEFTNHPDCRETIYMSMNFYSKVGFDPPWIGYYAKVDDNYVGAAGFKGKPKDGKIEIAYGTFAQYRRKGIGTEICRQLVLISRQTDPNIRITARTLPENNESASILTKNGFNCLGIVHDDEDGVVWEWELIK